MENVNERETEFGSNRSGQICMQSIVAKSSSLSSSATSPMRSTLLRLTFCQATCIFGRRRARLRIDAIKCVYVRACVCTCTRRKTKGPSGCVLFYAGAVTSVGQICSGYSGKHVIEKEFAVDDAETNLFVEDHHTI